jgi:hypothetical protein
VIGAVIDPGRCLDLTTQEGILAVQSAHKALVKLQKFTGEPLPQNVASEKGKRNLDCAVIRHLHRAQQKMAESDPAVLPHQTVRTLFAEGKKLYRGAGFHNKTHIQICVIDQSRIFGVFRLPAWHQRALGIGQILYM